MLDPLTSTAISTVGKGMLGAILGGGPKQVTLRTYNPGRKMYEGYKSEGDREGSFSGFNYGDYGINLDDAHKEFIDKILKENPGTSYSAKDDRFVVSSDHYYPTGFKGVTGRESANTSNPIVQQQNAFGTKARNMEHTLNDLYGRFRKGTLEADDSTGDAGSGTTEEYVPDTLLDTNEDGPTEGLLTYDPGYSEETPQPRAIENNFQQLAQPYSINGFVPSQWQNMQNQQQQPVIGSPYLDENNIVRQQPQMQQPQQGGMSSTILRNLALKKMLGG